MMTYDLTHRTSQRLIQSSRFLALLFFMCLLLKPYPLLAATLTSTVDKTTIPANETFTLHVTYDDDPADEEIEITPLQQQFKIAARNKTSSIRIINGHASRETVWYFELSPRKTGTLLIPSFSINNSFSEAIQITVTDAPKTVTNTGRNIYPEVEIDKKDVHVQEQLIVTWRLVSSLPISDPVMEQPTIDNVLVQDLGSRQYQRSSPDGKIEVVLEQRYAFFPQQSGTLTIPAQQFQFLVNTQRRFQSGLLHNSQEKRRVLTESLNINVLPAPAMTNNQQWLPAIKIEMAQDIQGLKQAGKATAGEAFTRVITIRALGLMAEQIPLPHVDVPDFKVYNDKPELRNDSNERGVYGIHTEKLMMIPEHEGTFTLPSIDMTWFNTTTQQWETTSLPSQTLEVLPAKQGAAASQAPTTPPPDAKTEISDPTNHATSDGTSESNQQWSPKKLALISSVAIGVSLLLARMLFLQRKLNSVLSTGKSSTGKSPTGTVPANEQPAVSDKVVHSRLTDTANANDIPGFYKATLDWARSRWQSNPPLTIDDIAARIHDPELRQHLLALDACLYGSHGQATPPLIAMASAMNQLPIDATKPVIRDDAPQLENLYEN